MARGGFLASEAALTRLAKVTGDRREASRLLKEAMISGQIDARGSPHLGPGDEDESSGGMVLRDLGDGPPDIVGPKENIPLSFWKEADSRERASWDFESGFAMSSSRKSKYPAYSGVALGEKQVNSFVALHAVAGRRGKADQTTKKERLRAASWNDWVAALVTLAHEQQISAATKQKELLELIEARLMKWKMELKPDTTVGPTARKVLERYKSDPPFTPFTVPKPKKP